MTLDGRVTAWVAAWQCLDGISVAYREAAKVRNAPDPAEVDRALARATLYAQLAQAPPEVGMMAGEWLTQQEQERIEKAERLGKFAKQWERVYGEGKEGDEE